MEERRDWSVCESQSHLSPLQVTREVVDLGRKLARVNPVFDRILRSQPEGATRVWTTADSGKIGRPSMGTYGR